MSKQSNFAYVTFKATFNTELGESIYICGSIEELGNWLPEYSKPLHTNKDLYPVWELDGEIFVIRGITIEFKFLIFNEFTKQYRWEILPNNSNRTYNVTTSGSHVIHSIEGSILPKTSNNKKISKSISEIKFNVQSKKINLKKDDEIKKSNKIDILNSLDYEVAKYNFENAQENLFSSKCKITFDNTRIIVVTFYLPFEVVKSGDKYYQIITDETLLNNLMFRLREVNLCEVIWVGILKNFEKFSPSEIDEIEIFFEEKNIFILKPNYMSDYNDCLTYINNILNPVFVECNIDINNNYFFNYDKYFNSYKEINDEFANKINTITKLNDIIFLNDIYLMLVPNRLLTININTKIGIYFHKAFPSSDIIKSFPFHNEIIKSILLCDVIGFHVFQFARNFLTSCKRILGLYYEVKYRGYMILNYLGRQIIIRVHHVGIDTNFINSLLHDENKHFVSEMNMTFTNENNDIIDFEFSPMMISNNIKPINDTLKLTISSNIINNPENKNLFTNSFRLDQNLDKFIPTKSLDEKLSVNDESLNTTKTRINDIINSYNFDEQVKYFESIINGRYSLVSYDANFDDSSSILLKLEGYRRFLKALKFPKKVDMHDKIVYIQVFKEPEPNTMSILLKKELDESVTELKKEFGEDIVKIIFVDSFTILQRYALYKVGSLLYFLQIRDGHCLYISEYIFLKYFFNKTLIDDKKNTNISESTMNTNKSILNKSYGHLNCIVNNSCLKIKKTKIETEHKEQYVNIKNKLFDFGIIISENIGAPKSLKSPLRINPIDISSVSNSIFYWFTLNDKEKWERLSSDIDFVIENTTFSWIKNFLIDMKRTDESQKLGLDAVERGLGFRVMKLGSNFTHLSKKKMMDYYINSEGYRLFFLDYEGTLQTKEKMIEETLLGYKPNNQLIKLLKKLCSNPKNIVFIVSGREKSKLDEWFGSIENINLASEHGYFYKFNKELRGLTDGNDLVYGEWKELFQVKDWSWKKSVIKILEGFTEKTEGSYLYVKQSIICWFYRNCDSEFGSIQAYEINTHLNNIFEYCKLDIVNGKGYVEIKNKGVNKGNFVSQIIKMLFKIDIVPDFLISIGDDTSDEEMFKYLNSVSDNLLLVNPNLKLITCTLDKKPSFANYYLNKPYEVVEYLESLIYKNTTFNNENNSSSRIKSSKSISNNMSSLFYK